MEIRKMELILISVNFRIAKYGKTSKTTPWRGDKSSR
jgi:hypothetical protein